MNKQELIGKYEGKKNKNLSFELLNAYIDFIRDLQQLDEPEKVTIPQFVADVIEGAREKSPELEDALHYTWGNGSKDFSKWYNKKSNRDLFARAWLDGYEVEKEPMYTVKIKATKHYFAKDGNGRIYFSLKYESAFTKIELEKVNLGWVFDCEGVEVEEVTE